MRSPLRFGSSAAASSSHRHAWHKVRAPPLALPPRARSLRPQPQHKLCQRRASVRALLRPHCTTSPARSTLHPPPHPASPASCTQPKLHAHVLLPGPRPLANAWPHRLYGTLQTICMGPRSSGAPQPTVPMSLAGKPSHTWAQGRSSALCSHAGAGGVADPRVGAVLQHLCTGPCRAHEGQQGSFWCVLSRGHKGTVDGGTSDERPCGTHHCGTIVKATRRCRRAMPRDARAGARACPRLHA